MPNLDVLDPTLSTTILTLGIALVVAAIVGGGFEAAGTKIPVITGWRRQAGSAALGLALVGFGWSALQAAHWRADYVALVKGMTAAPTFPPQVVADNLNELAVHAASDINRNCEIAYFIYNHKVEIPIAVRLQLVSAQHGASPALQCYLKVADLAAAAVSQAHDAVAVTTTATPSAKPGPLKHRRGGAKIAVVHVENSGGAGGGGHATATAPPSFPQPPPLATPTPSAGETVTASAASDTNADRILEAITQVGASGWMYLGKTERPGQLGAKRTVLEATPQIGGSLTTLIAVHLRDPAAQRDRSHARVVGVIPKGSTVVVDSLSGAAGPDVWARVKLTQQPAAK